MKRESKKMTWEEALKQIKARGLKEAYVCNNKKLYTTFPKDPYSEFFIIDDLGGVPEEFMEKDHKELEFDQYLVRTYSSKYFKATLVRLRRKS